MNKRWLTALLVWFGPLLAHAQFSPEWNAAKIRLQMEKLQVLGRVLYVAAHPDDENTQLLAYLANGAHYETAYLALTRGDGGQNLIGDEQGSELGLIRTQELLAARRIDGARQFFSRANDFGFSKSAKETLRIWGHQRILADVVWIIRRFRPDIIICRFPEDARAGHGHHWASAILAHEAFYAAADPRRFPEQLRYVKPWQAKRILWNTYRFGSFNTTSPDQFHFDVGGFNPLLGESYGELAAESRSMHKSQGFGVPRTRGRHEEYFKTIAGPVPLHSLMDGINTSWNRLPDAGGIASELSRLLAGYRAEDPAASVPALLALRARVSRLKEGLWRREKLRQIDELIQACSGLYLEAFRRQPYVVAGQTMDLELEAINRSALPMRLDSVNLAGTRLSLDTLLAPDQDIRLHEQVTVAPGTPISQPYWLLRPHPQGYYQIPDQLLVGLPENPPALSVRYHLHILRYPFSVQQPLAYEHTDPVRGEHTEQLGVAPALTLDLDGKVYAFAHRGTKSVRLHLEAFRDSLSGHADLQVPAPFRVLDNHQAFDLARAGDRMTLTFHVELSSTVDSSRIDTLRALAETASQVYRRGITVISYEHIPDITVFPPAQARLLALQLRTRGHRIGYVMGAGDQVPQALEQIGYRVQLLDRQDLSRDSLSRFDAIVLGVRAFNTDGYLRFLKPRLMDFVRQGGVLVVQYNKDFGLVSPQLGPYPFHVTSQRVTNEDSPVKFLLPGDPVLNEPNRIGPADFRGWIQERGIYFVTGADPRYRLPLAMNDPGEALQNGSLLVCDYGKGKYVYTGLDFFRELPAGVPGAFRLFANLLAPRP